MHCITLHVQCAGMLEVVLSCMCSCTRVIHLAQMTLMQLSSPQDSPLIL